MSPGTDISLGDLAAGAAEETASEGAASAAADAATDESTGEWAMKIFDRLEEKGLLEPILFGPDSNIKESQTPTSESQTSDGGESDRRPVDADEIAEIGKTVIDTLGDVPISEVVKHAEENPEQVNQLIDKKLEGEL